MAKKKSKAELRRIRSRAAKKAWQTRKENLRQIALSQGDDPEQFIHDYFSALGRKGYEALKERLEQEAANQGVDFEDYKEDYYEYLGQRGYQSKKIQDEKKRREFLRRSEAARKGWETRRRKKVQQAEDRRAQEQEQERRRRRREIDFSGYRYVDEIRLTVRNLSKTALFALVKDLRDRSVSPIRFIREVPTSPKYPNGVASTHWHNILTWSNRKIQDELGSMLMPGVDYIVEVIFKDANVKNFPVFVQRKFNSWEDTKE